MRYSFNVGAVWGQMSTGGGQKSLNEIMAAMNVHGPDSKNFFYKDRKSNCRHQGEIF